MNDDDFMQLALNQAHLGADANEIPVGAVLVHRGVVVAQAHNLCIQLHDPTAHAEILVLRAAAQHLKNYRLEDCELFVTLEPCAMCAGAILHARLKRVVFGALDAKTGAAGSVLNVFDNALLNHQTQITAGIKSQECGQALQAFFKYKRQLHKIQSIPLREDALRTPEDRFCNLPNYPWPSFYIQSLTSLAGLRLHYLDIAPDIPTERVILCLHGANEWSYVFRHPIARLQQQRGVRIIAPDCIGFGKSDKPKRESAHSLEFHTSYLLELLEFLNLHNVQLLTRDLGRTLANQLILRAPGRFDLIAPIEYLVDPENSMTQQERLALLDAPFPNNGFKSAVRSLAQKV